MRLTIVFGFALLLFSCSKKKDSIQEDRWANTSVHKLKNENIELKLPKSFMPSSRYRLKEDIPILAKDSVQLLLVQKAIEGLEFEDSEVDVFFDLSRDYRFLIICNIERIDFNKSDAAILKSQIEKVNQENSLLSPGLVYGKLNAKMEGNSRMKMVKYSSQIKDYEVESVTYNSIYYLTGESYTLVIYEFSEDEDTIEDYLWSVKAG